MIPGVFVMGTGTGVGKTLVVAGIMRRLLSQGVRAMAMKPVQTGATRDASGHLVAPDLEFVCRAAQLDMDETTAAHAAPYLYEPACSPHLAARLAGRPIAIEQIVESAHWLSERYETLVVEGAGGLLVPLNEKETMLDLAVALDMPVLLVGHSGLGTINHVLLSVEALRRRNLNILGVILNDVHPVAEAERFIHDDNAAAITAFGQIPVLARVPYLGTPPDFSRLDESLRECDL